MRHLIHRHIGARAEGMILVSAVWCLIGLNAIIGPAPTPLPSVWHLTIPGWATAVLWIGCGTAAALTSPSERWSETGISLLTIPPSLPFASFAWAWVAELIPGPPPGYPRGWYSALFYLAMILWVIHLGRIPANVRAPLRGRRR